MASQYEFGSEISRILDSVGEHDNQDEHETERDCTDAARKPLETLHIYPVEGGFLILREAEDENIIDSFPQKDQKEHEPIIAQPFPTKTDQLENFALPYFLFFLCLFICIDTLVFSMLSEVTPTATITILLKVQRISMTTTLLAVPQPQPAGQVQDRILPNLTLTESKSVQASGKGHQDAGTAQGYITFYNGLLTAQTIPIGTMLTGSDGVRVVTNQNAFIPPASPPIEGQITVLASAVKTGSQGNIPAHDINEPCCATSILAVNATAFQGGQSARDFTYVTTDDIQSAAITMKDAILQNLQRALEAQLLKGEALVTPVCMPSISSDHKIGQESIDVTVTVFVSCNAVAYESQALESQTAQIISNYTAKRLGTAYSLIGAIQTKVLQTTITDQRRGLASIKATITGTWAYRLPQADVAQILHLVAGKSQQQATKIILVIPGIKAVRIAGIGNNDALPTNTNRIHLLLLYEAV